MIRGPFGVQMAGVDGCSNEPAGAITMDNRYENLQPQRIRKLGFVLLALFSILLLANNRVIYPLLEAGGPSNWYQGVLAAMCGVVFAQFSLLAIWSVLSPQPLLRRLLFLICGAVALITAWSLGFAGTRVQTESIDWLAQEEIWVLGFLPIVFLAHALPLVGARLFGSLVLAQDGEVPQRRHVSIAGLLGATGVVAFALAAAQLLTRLGMHQTEIFVIASVASGIAFAFGLLGALPAVLLLFSRRKFFWVWSILLILLAPGITAAIFGGLRLFRLSPPGSTWIFVTLSAGYMIVLTIGIGNLRLLGYRLTKQTMKKVLKGSSFNV